MIRFTENCEEAIRRHDLPSFVRQLKSQLESYTSVSVSDAESDPSQVDVGAHVLELKLKALILDMIHNIEVVEQLSTSSLSDVADWQWQKQLRFVSVLRHFPFCLTNYANVHVVNQYNSETVYSTVVLLAPGLSVMQFAKIFFDLLLYTYTLSRYFFCYE